MMSMYARYRTLRMACVTFMALGMVMAGCSHKEADIYRSPDMTIRPTASFTIAPGMPGTALDERDPRVHNALIHERIRSAIGATLETKGYRQSSFDTAEYLVRYRIGVRTAEREVGGFVLRDNPAGPSGSGPAATLTVTRTEMTEGNLVIELVERQTGLVVYRGEVHGDNVTPWDASEWMIAMSVRVLLQDL